MKKTAENQTSESTSEGTSPSIADLTRKRLGRRETFSIVGLLFAAVVFGPVGKTEPLFAQLENQPVVGGGKLTGRLLNPDAGENEAWRIEIPGGGEIVLDHQLLRKTEAIRPETVTYRMTAPLIPDTVENHEKTADWCQQNGLSSEARLHRERILELNPDHEATRRKLGYDQKDGVWMTPLQRREQLGYETFAGRSMTKQEIELERQKLEFKKEATVWKKKIKTLLPRLRDGEVEAKEELRGISSPSALSAVTDALRDEKSNPALRICYVQAMGNIGTPGAMGDLAMVALVDDDYEVRLTALEMIKAKPKAIPGAIQFFRRGLRHSDNAMINRAAAALDYLDAAETMGDLINALVTSHRRTINEGAKPLTASFTNRGTTFSPGTGATSKTITETFENDDVLAALRGLVTRHCVPPVDFRFDIPAWKWWYAEQKEIYRFSPRRDF